MMRLQLSKWMHGWLGIASTAVLLTVGFAQSESAGHIIWVTRNRDAVPADWEPILTNAGYAVTPLVGGGWTPSEAQVDEMNAADLVIFDNSHGSDHAGSAAVWNSLSVPLLTMANYPLNNWGLTSGNPPNEHALRPIVFFPEDPIWTGVTLPLEANLFTSVRGANANIQRNGVIIAGEGTGKAMQIARWGAIADGGGARLYFSGHRDGANNSMNLTALGQTVWLNAIDSLINPPADPVLRVTKPENNAEDVIVLSDLRITFDRQVQAGTGNISLYTSDHTLVEAFDVETSERLAFGLVTVTITPTDPLPFGTTFYVLIDATAIEAVDDGSPFAGISDPTSWSFSTGTTENDQFTIVWVTKDRDVVPTDWWSILIIAGYNVTAFTGGLTPTGSEIDELNAADLVIFDNSHGSDQAGTAAVWNSLSVPLLTMANYPLNNWGLTVGNPPNKHALRPPVFFPADPIWTGVTLPLAQDIFTSVRGANGNIQHGGLVLAGEADNSAMYIARWAPGAITAGGGARLYVAGHRDGATVDMSLTALGQTLWLNAVDSLINPPADPLLMMTTPENNAEDVIVFNDLGIIFDRLVRAGTGNISLYTSDDTLVEAFDVETSGRLAFGIGTVTIDPTAALEVGTTFYVLIDATAIEAVDDGTPFAGISDPTAWRFTTDGTPPEDITLWPANGAINMRPDIDLVIDFDENVMAGGGNITVHRMSDDSVVESIDVATAAISGSHVTLTLSEPLAYSTAYYVNAPVGVFTDLSGNAWAGTSGSADWSFSTTFAPVVTYTSDGATYVAHVFTEDDVFHPHAELDVEVLVVGGGGGGGSSQGLSSAGGGAGGAGGLVFTELTVSGPVSVTVGRGGAGGGVAGVSQSARGGDGLSSYFGTIRALGGGGGPGGDAGGNDGGSGSGRRNNAPGQAYQPLSTSGGFGHAGGGGTTGGGGSGGGGAGGPGVDLVGWDGTDGGPGMQFDIAGTPVWFAAGGGGGAREDAAIGFGGSGIGGNGANNGTKSTPGGAHTGSGGGGGNNAQPGSGGGSGIVIVRYVEEGFYGLRATDVLDTAADLHATLNAADRTVEVTLYWSTANHANAAAWQADATKESAAVGLFADAVREPLTAAATGLSANTTYYYTFHAEDTIGNDDFWSPTASFETVSPVVTPVLANLGATRVGPFTARLQAELTVGGIAEAYVAWGESAPDPADDIHAWDHVVSIGTILQGEPFSTDLTVLAADQTHQYRLYATNPEGAGWSELASFTTPASKVTWNGSDDFADMLELLKNHIQWSVPVFNVYQEFASLEAAETLRVAALQFRTAEGSWRGGDQDDPARQAAYENARAAFLQILADVGQTLDALQLRGLLGSSQLDHNLAAYKILSEATPGALNQFARQSPWHADLLMQLFSDTDLMVQMASAYGAAGGRYHAAMEIYDAIQQASPNASEGVFQRMAVAVSLVFAVPMPEEGIIEVPDGDPEDPVEPESLEPMSQEDTVTTLNEPAFVDPIQRYLSYEQWFLAGELDPAFGDLGTWELTKVVNQDVPNEILVWGREMLRTFRPDLVDRDLEHGRYVTSVNTEIFYGSSQVHLDRADLHRYQNILANGGVCGRRAYFGRFILRSFGIPAMPRPEPGHATLAHWTPNGWQARLGGNWGNRAWMRDWARNTHNLNFLAMTEARNSAEGFPQVERAQWIGALMGETWNLGLFGSGGALSNPTMCPTMGPWHALSLIRQYEVVEELKAEAAASDEDFGAASWSSGYIDYPQYEVPEADRTVVVDPDGVITIPAAAAQLPEDNLAWGGEVRYHVALRLMESNLGGAQLHYGRYSGGKLFTYTIEVPASRSYALHARAAAVGSHAEDPSWPSALALSVNDAPDVEMPLPYTAGLWDTSEPIEIDLGEGTNTLVFRRAAGKGITIRDFTLMPIAGGVHSAVSIGCSQSGSIVYGTPTTFTATVSVNGDDGPATGMVSFRDGPTLLGTGELSDGSATFDTSKLPVGGYSVVAFYNGDETFASSSSDPVVLTVTPKPVSLSGVEAADKVYDGTTAATLAGGTLSGVLDGDTVTIQPGTGTFDSANVGTWAVTAGGYTLGGTDGGNYALSAQPTVPNATISPRPVVLAGTRVYDGTDAIAAANLIPANKVDGDELTLSGGAVLAGKDVGQQAVSAPGFSLGGSSAANYTIDGASGAVKITPKALDVTGATALGKVYDGTTAAAIDGGALLEPLAPGSGTADDGTPYVGDEVTLAATGQYASKDVGTGIAVVLDEASLEGAQAGNYTLIQPGDLVGDITPKALVVTNAAVADKVYDGTTAATFTAGALPAAQPAGGGSAGDGMPYEGDDVSVSLSGTFDSADAGVDKSVTSDSTLEGEQAGNYTLTQPEGLSATILAAPLTVTADDQEKDYGVALELGPGSTAFTAEGLIEGETIGSVTLGSPGAAAEAVPGDYPITPSDATGGRFDPDNYDIQYEDGTLSVLDADPPTPDPMSFAVAPHVVDGQSISMTATTATDAFSPPVSYLFENVTAETDSGWTLETVWTDTGLSAGVPYSYRVKARDDLGNETGWSAEASATIPPTVNFSPVSGSGPESTSPVTVTVTLSVEYGEPVTVEHRLATPGGTAVEGTDFVYTPGSLVFEPGQTSRSFTFEVIDDDEAKPDLTVLFELGEITNGLAGADTTFTYTIEADEADWHTVPFRDDFEARELGDLDGQFGWIAEGVQVQAETTFGGSAKAASIVEDAGFMRRTFNDERTELWTDMRIRVQPMADDTVPVVPGGYTTVVYVGTECELMVFDGAEALSTGVTLEEDTWVRITLHSDYGTSTWRLYVDGSLTGTYAFHETVVTSFTDFEVRGGTSTHVDDVAITLESPDASFAVYALTVTNGSGSGSYTAGTVVEIVADDPSEGHEFDAWTGDTDEVADVNSPSTTLTMPAAAVELTATYRDSVQPVDDLYEYALDNQDPSAGIEDGLLRYSHLLRNDDASLVYQLQTRESLLLGEWDDVDAGTFPAVTNDTGTVFDEVSYRIEIEDPARFFRLRIYQQPD